MEKVLRFVFGVPLLAFGLVMALAAAAAFFQDESPALFIFILVIGLVSILFGFKLLKPVLIKNKQEAEIESILQDKPKTLKAFKKILLKKSSEDNDSNNLAGEAKFVKELSTMFGDGQVAKFIKEGRDAYRTWLDEFVRVMGVRTTIQEIMAENRSLAHIPSYKAAKNNPEFSWAMKDIDIASVVKRNTAVEGKLSSLNFDALQSEFEKQKKALIALKNHVQNSIKEIEEKYGAVISHAYSEAKVCLGMPEKLVGEILGQRYEEKEVITKELNKLQASYQKQVGKRGGVSYGYVIGFENDLVVKITES